MTTTDATSTGSTVGSSAEPKAGAAALEVGARVRTKHSLDRSAAPDDMVWESGSIVEDFASELDSSEIGRDWGLAHRWGVALDNGCLVFRDSDDLEALGSS